MMGSAQDSPLLSPLHSNFLSCREEKLDVRVGHRASWGILDLTSHLRANMYGCWRWVLCSSVWGVSVVPLT